ncbi:MAG TPA: hypothetical protein VGV57_08850 [Thermoleophilaceae bacterium]|nr:hypothetical protein [Thermoleophilaceae bacterium]
MSTTVCLTTGTLYYPQGGGHMWVSLNWALGLRAAGCDVVWLEGVTSQAPPAQTQADLAVLKGRLEAYGLADRLGLFSWEGDSLAGELLDGCLTLEEARNADLLLNLAYGVPASVVSSFGRSALVDIDPGLLQVWMSAGNLTVAEHDVYFTIGETVGRPEAKFPDCGISWHYTPPPVFLPEWAPSPPAAGAPYTTVSDWWGEWVCHDGDMYSNGKRDAFLGYVDLPRRASAPLELALCLAPGEDDERRLLEQHGWNVVGAGAVTGSPDDYRAYIQRSRGELSCAKPSCMRLENAWISDRTLCYLASGKPAIVQHTGESRVLPDSEGLFRFRDIDEAVGALATVEADYHRQSRLARRLVEERFDAEKVVPRLLERALP